MIIYKITNLLNNKIYIGQTTQNIKQRWWDHCKPSSNSFLSNAIRKYSRDNFKIEQIDTASTIDELNEKEIYWISYYNSTNKSVGYNIAIGGENRIFSEETKNKLSIANKGKKKPPMTEEHRKKLSESASKRKHSKETKKKMSEWHTGKKFNEETKKKMSESKKRLFNEKNKI